MGGLEIESCSSPMRRRRYTVGWLPAELQCLVSDEDDVARFHKRRRVPGSSPSLSAAFSHAFFKSIPAGLSAKIYLQAPDDMIEAWILQEAAGKGMTELSPTIDCAAVLSGACWQRLLAYRKMIKELSGCYPEYQDKRLLGVAILPKLSPWLGVAILSPPPDNHLLLHSVCIMSALLFLPQDSTEPDQIFIANLGQTAGFMSHVTSRFQQDGLPK